MVATGKIKHVQNPHLEDWELLKSLLLQEQWKDCKVTMSSPTWQHMQLAERIGNFERLRYLPFGKNVVLGVVSTKDPKMEDVEELMGRVEQATDVIANGQGRSREEVMRDSIGVSPQCGFASMSLGGGVGMTEDKMWEKLVLVWDLARRIWPDTI